MNPQIDDLQFDIKIRTRTSFKEILKIKKANTDDVRLIFKKMGLDMTPDKP